MLLEFDGTFIFALISFIIFVLIMNAILYKPVMKVINERQKFFDKNQKTVMHSKQKVKETLEYKDNVINSTKKEASKMLSDALIEAKDEKQHRLGQKKEICKEKINGHITLLENEKKEAKKILKDEFRELVKSVCEGILTKDVNVSIDEEKLDNILKIEK